MSNTSEFLFAHVDLDGVQVGPGDQVLVHDPITEISFGEVLSYQRTATVSKASLLSRAWVYLTARLELTMLYEVSFSTTRFSKSKHYPRAKPYKAITPITLHEGVKA
ncbi:hypothetical protein [Polynucleobacter antarcticus]|nr:hypothetical protein [Polynucleobacter antarcticus]